MFDFVFLVSATNGLIGSNTTFWRDGKMQNGRFPDNSLGESDKQSFTNYGAKLGIILSF